MIGPEDFVRDLKFESSIGPMAKNVRAVDAEVACHLSIENLLFVAFGEFLAVTTLRWELQERLSLRVDINDLVF